MPARRWSTATPNIVGRRHRAVDRLSGDAAGWSAIAPSTTPAWSTSTSAPRYDVLDFWEPLYNHGRRELVLDPDEFYILVSREAVHVPPAYAAEMAPFDPLVGEFRVHYAGFFDPGFGHSAAGGTGSRAVLEVRSHEVPFILEHGQIVGRLVYERMLRAAASALRQRPRLQLPGAGPEAVEAFPGGVRAPKSGRWAAMKRKLSPVHPGSALRKDFLKPMRLSEDAAARARGLSTTLIAQLCRGRYWSQPIRRVALDAFLGTSPGFWTGMQAQYDREQADGRPVHRFARADRR